MKETKMNSYLWTSEAVSPGHPDKVADQVADAVLDAYLADDPMSRVACEVTLTTGTAFVTGEITSESCPNIEQIVRKTICSIGYDSDESGFNGNTIEIINRIKEQSPEISKAVTNNGDLGAGDQGMMFGYATNESKLFNNSFMPLCHTLSFAVIDLLNQNRATESSILWPDAKSQVTMRYDAEGNPAYVDSVLISVCHKQGLTIEQVKEQIQEFVVVPFSKGNVFVNSKTKFLINPAGIWNVGGPTSDTGLSGRKIVVDNYGSDCPVGGGSFSGKDPTKVDRSGAYACRHIAKNIVSKGWADKCQLQVSYAIGISEPVSIRLQTFGTEKVPIQTIDDFVKSISLTPKSIIDRLQLRRPQYLATASGGHFGRNQFSWEKLDLL